MAPWPADLTEFQKAVNLAVALRDEQINACASKKAESKRFTTHMRKLEALFAGHRRIAALTFAEAVDVRASLQLDQPQSKTQAGRLDEMRRFYRTLLNSTQHTAHMGVWHVPASELTHVQKLERTAQPS